MKASVIEWMMEDIHSFDVLKDALEAYFEKFPEELKRLTKVMIDECGNEYGRG